LFSCQNDKKATAVSSTGDKALDELSALISKDPQDHTLLFNRAEYLFGLENYDAAIIDLNKAISLDSTKYRYFHLLSDSYMDYYKSKDALITMEDCVKRLPNSIPSLLKLSETQLILKQYDASLATVAKLLKIDDQNSEAFFMMGMNFRALEEKEKAIGAFQTAVEFDPELLDAWMILGDLLAENKNPLAAEYYNTAIEVAPNNPLPYHSKAYYLQNNDRIDEAIDLYKKINVIDKNYVYAYLNAGILYYTQEAYTDAFEQFDIMAKVKPQNATAYYYRGLTNVALNKIEAATSDLNNCLNLNPDFDKAKKALSEIGS